MTVPKGMRVRDIEAAIEQQRDWIAAHWAKLCQQHVMTESVVLPERIDLLATGESWQVVPQVITPAELTVLSLRVLERPPQLCLRGADEVIQSQWQEGLRRWVQQRAVAILGPWLAELSAETGLRYSKLTVRGQKSRWGSCSSRGAISLNYQLLFLPLEQVRYVLIHELCHTVEHNHSEQFWALVARWVPEYRHLRQAMKLSAQQIPAWIRTLG